MARFGVDQCPRYPIRDAYKIDDLFWANKSSRNPKEGDYAPILWETSPGKVVARKTIGSQIKDFGEDYTEAVKFANLSQYGDFRVWICQGNDFNSTDEVASEFLPEKGCRSLWAMFCT